MAIYVKFAEEKRPKSVLKFLEQFYYNRERSDYAIGYYTYYDKECKNIQNDRKWRSFDDLLELVQTYYPSISHIKLMHYLLILKIPISNNNITKPHLGICEGMSKIRYIPYHTSSYSSINEKMRKSIYTWGQLLEPLGIFNEKDFKEYIKKNKIKTINK